MRERLFAIGDDYWIENQDGEHLRDRDRAGAGGRAHPRRHRLHRPDDPRLSQSRGYLSSVSILNIGRYIEMMITPTIAPTAIIISGSMIDVSDWIEASTSSS
jgi:hypothetical protein